MDGRSEAPFFLLRILAMPVAAAFIVFNRAIVPMTGFGAAFFLVKSQSNFAVAALSIPASTPAPRLLVCPVARATAPSSTSIILPIMTSDKPAVFSMLPAPCQVTACYAHSVRNSEDILAVKKWFSIAVRSVIWQIFWFFRYLFHRERIVLKSMQ